LAARRFTPPQEKADAIRSVLAERSAIELRLDEGILAALESGWTFSALSRDTGLAKSWLHTRAKRAEELRPRDA